MSYMNHSTAFAAAGEIQQLSSDEIDLVGGGTLSPGTKVALRFVAKVAGISLVGGIALGIGVEMLIYFKGND